MAKRSGRQRANDGTEISRGDGVRKIKKKRRVNWQDAVQQ
jgi:hypothetical protein